MNKDAGARVVGHALLIVASAVPAGTHLFYERYPALKIPAAKAAGISAYRAIFRLSLAGRKYIAVYFKLNTPNAFSSSRGQSPSFITPVRRG